jgi:hypothetical protein
MSASPTVYVDIAHDDSTYIGPHKITPPTRYWAKAVASALKALGTPMNAAVVFRRKSVTIRQARLDFLLRGDA